MYPHVLSVQRGRCIAYWCCYVLLFAGCSGAHIPLAEDLATAEPMQVTGRSGFKLKETIQFGPFKTHDVHRSWVKGGDLTAHRFEKNERSQQFSFKLSDAGVDPWFVSCDAHVQKGTVHAGLGEIDVKNQSGLTCYISPDAKSAERWTLKLNEKGERALDGDLTDGTHTIIVSGTRKLKGGLPSTTETGYTFHADGRTLAAVEVVGHGMVWISKDASSTRNMLAAAASALLLLEDLRAHLPG